MNILDKIRYRVLFYNNAIKNHKDKYKLYQKYKNTLILIYSPGATGSSTIYYSLMKYFPYNKVLHVHFLSDYWLSIHTNEMYLQKRNVYLTQVARKNISKYKKVKIITLIRDPFSRSVSAYFHNKKKQK